MKTILVSGAGVAGPCLAYWLQRHGFAPTIVASNTNTPSRPRLLAADLVGSHDERAGENVTAPMNRICRAIPQMIRDAAVVRTTTWHRRARRTSSRQRLDNQHARPETLRGGCPR